MTCYWNSIQSRLIKEDFTLLGMDTIPKCEQLISLLKEKNKPIETLWNGTALTNKEKEEHYEAIKCYNIKGIHNGHLTSICDSFLLLICDLLNVNVEHTFLNNTIVYSCKGITRRTLRFKSNQGHFECA